jgi:hypothetical protein
MPRLSVSSLELVGFALRWFVEATSPMAGEERENESLRVLWLPFFVQKKNPHFNHLLHAVVGYFLCHVQKNGDFPPCNAIT